MDPTHFSAVRHYYQQTVEFLLDDRALINFPEINKTDVHTFRDTYSTSAFVCRYPHCVFSTDGFQSPSQRAKHESQHQRRFRCAHPSCVNFTTGFVTQNLLKRHNERYHPASAECPSLVESLATAVEITRQRNTSPVTPTEQYATLQVNRMDIGSLQPSALQQNQVKSPVQQIAAFAPQDRLNSTTPTTFDMQDRRNLQPTVSYWSVPEQTDFPALLRHFGTDWHGIAKFMTSKTHIMV
jgi:hypothetical protein